MLPAEERETSPSLRPASRGALTAMLPLPVVESEMVEVVPAVLTPLDAIVIPPPALVRLTTPQPLKAVELTVETLLKVAVPPPD